MDYKIVHNPEFTVVGVSEVFKYDDADTEIPNSVQNLLSLERIPSSTVCMGYRLIKNWAAMNLNI